MEDFGLDRFVGV